MKNVLLYLIISVIGCSQKNEPFLLTKFHFPTDGLEQGKLLVYENSSNGTQEYTYYKTELKDGNRILTSKSFTDEVKLDSSKWLISDNTITLLESYLTYYPDPQSQNSLLLNGNIEKQTRAKEVETLEVEYDLPNNGYGNIETRDVFMSDTVLTWNGQSINCKKYLTNIIITFGNKMIPLAKNEQKSTVTKYYGENLGLLKYSVNSSKGISDWELVEIK